MLVASCSQFTGQSTADYNNGAVLNSNLEQDIQCRHESESFYGFQTLVAALSPFLRSITKLISSKAGSLAIETASRGWRTRARAILSCT